MASTFSFDIVSSYDHQELKNAIDQTRREVGQRYDLKDTKTEIEEDPKKLTITTDSETSLQAVRDMMESKLVRRNISLKILDYGEEEQASGGRVRQVVTLKEGISEDLAKQINKRIKRRVQESEFPNTGRLRARAGKKQRRSADCDCCIQGSRLPSGPPVRELQVGS